MLDAVTANYHVSCSRMSKSSLLHYGGAITEKTWTIPDEHAKAGKGHVLPLSNWAIAELQKLKVMAGGSRYVLPTADRSGPADLKYITRSVARCLKRFKRHGVAAFTPHDLRRTGRTGLARLGVKVDIAERVLNHARERIEANSDGIRHPDKSHVLFLVLEKVKCGRPAAGLRSRPVTCATAFATLAISWSVPPNS